MKKIILLAAAAAALSVTACAGQTPAGTITVSQADSNTITVTSREEIKVVPDIAEIRYGVYTQAADPVSCQDQNASGVNAVIDLLKSSGIDEKNIQTSGYGLNPNYDWIDNKRVTTGYEMTTEITVSAIPIDQSGQLISDSVNAGINSIDSVVYKSSQFDDSYQEALKLAIEAAKTKAAAMAEAGGRTLDGIVEIQEFANEQEARYMNGQYSADRAAGAGAVAEKAAVMPGEVGVSATVTVKFQIK